ncbi:MAG: FtsX-like permease family protein, partial [Flavobacteriaceae bacterium]|nr:FtsX-like permease family protein [Flavobacteriaceae bacterium]
MLRNYFKLGLRNILKNKGFYFLNTLSLVVGLIAVLLIGLWVAFEFNFNKSIKDYPRIARVMQNQTFAGKVETGPNAPLQLSPILQTEFSDQFEHTATSTFPNDMDLSYDERKIVSIGVFAQPSLPYILNVEMLSGQRKALEDPSSIIISESVANTLFGNQNPVGKILKLGSSMQLSVRGVYKDFAKDTDFANYKFIGSWEYLKDVQDYENRLGWGNNWFQVLAKIKEGKSFDKVSQLIKNVKQDNYEEAAKAEFFLFPLADWHLYSEFENGRSVGGNIQYVKIFGTVGLFILFLASINYMNLSTARALKRSKEVGIRKTLGSSRKQLIIQFFSESFILIVFSFFVALFVVMLVLPDFNDLTQKSIAIQFFSPTFWLISLALIGITALLSSAYPAFYLSAFK